MTLPLEGLLAMVDAQIEANRHQHDTLQVCRRTLTALLADSAEAQWTPQQREEAAIHREAAWLGVEIDPQDGCPLCHETTISTPDSVHMAFYEGMRGANPLIDAGIVDGHYLVDEFFHVRRDPTFDADEARAARQIR